MTDPLKAILTEVTAQENPGESVDARTLASGKYNIEQGSVKAELLSPRQETGNLWALKITLNDSGSLIVPLDVDLPRDEQLVEKGRYALVALGAALNEIAETDYVSVPAEGEDLV